MGSVILENSMKKNISLYIIISLSLSFFACSSRVVPPILSGKKNQESNSAMYDYFYVEGLRNKIFGNFGSAIEMFERCIDINPDNDAAYYNSAQIFVSQGDMHNAKKYLNKALSNDDQNIWYYNMLWTLYFSDQQIDSAILVCRKATQKFPENDDLLMSLGVLYSENGKFDEALKIFEGLDEKYGINEKTTVQTISTLVQSNKISEAIDKAKKLIEEFPDEISYRGILAELYTFNGDKDKAMSVYSELIESNPDNPNLLLTLCQFLVDEKKYTDANNILSKIIINTSIPLEEKAMFIYSLMENEEYLRSSYEEINLNVIVLEELSHYNEVVCMLRPEMFSRLGQTDEAINLLNTIIERSPDYYYAWENLLVLYYQKRNFVSLEERADVCSRKFNMSYNAKYLFSFAATENGHYSEALESLSKAEIVAGNNEDLKLQILSLRADIYYRMGDLENTFKTYDEALSANEDNALILNNYAYYLAEKDLDLKKAYTMAKQVIEQEPENATYLDTYGWTLYKRGKLRAAERVFLDIIKGGDINYVYYEHLGYIYKKMKKYDTAIRFFQKAIDLGADADVLNKEIETCVK